MAKTLLKTSVGTLFKEYFLITLGLTLYALGWAMFLTPNGMIGGGVTGFAAILQYATNGHIPISVTYFVMNIPASGMISSVLSRRAGRCRCIVFIL